MGLGGGRGGVEGRLVSEMCFGRGPGLRFFLAGEDGIFSADDDASRLLRLGLLLPGDNPGIASSASSIIRFYRHGNQISYSSVQCVHATGVLLTHRFQGHVRHTLQKVGVFALNYGPIHMESFWYCIKVNTVFFLYDCPSIITAGNMLIT